jgi:hypothetical protein
MASTNSTNFDFNGLVPKDRSYSNFTVACQNLCLRAQGQVPQDAICQNLFVQNLLNLCGATTTPTDPQYDAYRQAAMRIFSALYEQCQAQETTHASNGDESSVPLFIAMFSKTLPHNGLGRVTPSAYETLRDAVNTRNVDLLSSVPNPGTTHLVQPLAAFLLNHVGPSPSALSMPAAPRFQSTETAGEMVEVYCQALCRDIAFVDFDTDATVASCVGYLNALSNYTGPTPVTTANIFRGQGDGDLIGPYASQFFFLESPIWPAMVPATVLFPTRTAANNRMITTVNYLSVQNGTVLEGPPTLAGTATYFSTGRDLSYVVWNDTPGQLYDAALRKALDQGASFSPLSPYLDSPLNANQDPFVTWSTTDVLSCLYFTAQVALSVAWYSKWAVNRRLRPEAYGNEVQQFFDSGTNPAGINGDLLTSGVLADIMALNGGTYYLPQAFPEGSPSHPSYPAGHATISGACVTVLKAFLDEDFVFPSPMVPSDGTGTALTAFVGPALTLGHELNKLASNISLGRDWAGVHYRSDGHEGILLGERVGILILQDWINRYVGDADVSGLGVGFEFHGYLGNAISITPQTTYGPDIQNVGSVPEFQVPDCCTSSSSS